MLVSLVNSTKIMFLALIIFLFVMSIFFTDYDLNTFMVKGGTLFQLIGFVFIILSISRFRQFFKKRVKTYPLFRDNMLGAGIVFNIAGLVLQFWYGGGVLQVNQSV